MKNDDLLSKYEVESFTDTEPDENELFEKYGVEEPKKNKNEFVNALSEVFKKGKEALPEVWEGLKESGPYAIDVGKTVFGQNPATTLDDIVAGWAKGLRGTGNIPAKGVGKESYFSPTEWEKTITATQDPGRQKLQGLASFLSNQIGVRNPVAATARAGLWAVGQDENPFTAMLGSSPFHLIRGATDLIKEMTPNKRSSISGNNVPPDTGSGGPNDIGGGLVDKALNIIGKKNLDEFAQNIAEKQNKKVHGSKWMEKNINPMPYTTMTEPELNESMALAKGRKVPIGNVFGDPALAKKFSNELAVVEDSPAKEIMMDTARELTDEGSHILKYLSSKGTPQQKAHIGDAIISETKNLKKEIKENYGKKYDAFDAMAEKSGITTNLSNLKEYADKALERINSSSLLKRQTPPEIIKALNDIIETHGENITLKQANFIKSNFGNIAYTTKDGYLAGLYKDLNRTAKKDIYDTIEKSDNTELKKLYDDAETYYEEEYVPFQDPDIEKYLSGKGDPDLLMQHFIRTGKLTDRSKLLRKITDKIEPTSRNLFGHAYLSNAINEMGRYDPLAGLTLWKKLGEGQREAIFGNHVPTINEHMKKVAMSSDALSMAANPKSGVQALPLLKKLETFAAQGSVGGLVGLGVSHDPLVSTLVGMATPWLSKQAASQHHNFLVNRHTSETYRNKVYRKIIRDIRSKGPNLPPHLRLLNDALDQAELRNLGEHEFQKND